MLREGLSAQGGNLEIRSKEKDLFLESIFEELTERFIEDMDEVGFEEDSINYFLQFLDGLEDEDIKRVLCIPANIRKNFLQKRLEESKDQKSAVETAIKILIEAGKKYGYTLGYHTSPKKISIPDKGDWQIRPYEMDDRDNMKMAYYSLDFDNLYLKKHPKYLYLVRAETGSDTAHKRDLKNNWGRAPVLSIVAECDIQAILKKIRAAL